MNKVATRKPSLLGRGLGYVVDAVLEAWNPKTATERRLWREHGHKFAGMAAGAVDRASANWNPPEGDANAVTLDDLPKVRARARDAALNDPIAQTVRRTMADHVVGTGMTPDCLIDHERLGISEQQAQDWQGECKAHFVRASASADVTARLNWQQLQRLLFLSVWDGGDVFPSFPMTPGEDGLLATRINLIEAERVETPPGKLNERNLLGGVQLDQWARVQGFWVHRDHPGDARPGVDRMKFEFWPTVRNGRRNAVQIYQQDRIGQARGIPGLAQALVLTDRLSAYLDETLITARLQNAMSIWVTTGADPSKAATALAALSGGSGNHYSELQQAGMQSGSVNLLRKGDEARFLGPTSPGQFTDAFMVRLLRAIAACLGAPYELMFGDLGSANYSSIRAGWQTFRKTISAWQSVVQPALDTYWRHVIHEGWLDGKLGKVGLKVPFEDAPDEWARVTWTPPKFGYIDPTKEFPAAKVGLEIGAISLTQLIAEAGGDVKDVIKQRASEQKLMKEAGLPLPNLQSGSTNQQGQVATSKKTDSDSSDDEEDEEKESAEEEDKDESEAEEAKSK